MQDCAGFLLISFKILVRLKEIWFRYEEYRIYLRSAQEELIKHDMEPPRQNWKLLILFEVQEIIQNYPLI